MADTSATPTTPSVATPVQFKEFRCTYDSCTKSFSRAEHLHRHALNHTSVANNTCLRCSAVFKRGDLLDRHMLRHKEKDDEAGGPGLGTLQTRKRLWRDENGTVHQKRRPEHEKKRTNSSSTPRKAHSRVVNPIDDNINPELRNEPLPALKSVQDLPQRGHHEMNFSPLPRIVGPMDDTWPVPSAVDEASQGPITESFGFLCNASWGAQPAETNNAHILYNDVFAPDTASSFNMPFTTINYYNWLFDSSIPSLGNLAPTAQMSQSTPSSRGLSISDASSEYKDGSRREYASTPFPENRTLPGYSESFARDLPTPETSAANQILAMSQAAGTNISATLGYGNEPTSIHRSFMPHDSDINMSSHVAQSAPPSSNHTSQLPNQDRKYPVIVENARLGILSFVAEVRPRNPDGDEITPDHPLLSLDNLQKYCDLFFSRFNNSYPLLHAATFDPARTDPLLLISALLLGATYDHKDSHLFAIGIHDSMRAQIFAHRAFHTRPTIWMLQTILLVECFGKSRAGQLQHDMSHLFHGLLINLIRRSDCQSARCPQFDPNETVDVEQRWRAEVEAEQKRRLALFCFMWDTQHAVLFSQSLCMNAAELRLTLPWNDALFDAQTAKEWCALNSIEQPQQQYLAVLKSYFNHRTDSVTRPLNALSRVLMLHGLMSVAWDLNRRDQTSLGLLLHKNLPWQSIIARSYNAWKSDFDIFTTSTLQTLSPTPSSFSSPSSIQEIHAFHRFTTSTLAIYHAAQILLQAEINDLQIFAGASHIIGRAVSKQDRDSSRIRIYRWALPGSLSAAKAASHAALLLRDGICRLDESDAGDAFHYPWCLYLATLTLWTFQTCSKSAEQSADDSICSEGEEDSDWDERAEMNALVSAMTRTSLEDLWKVATKYRSSDLPRIMARYLSGVRWAVVQEAVIVLRCLEDKGRMN